MREFQNVIHHHQQKEITSVEIFSLFLFFIPQNSNNIK